MAAQGLGNQVAVEPVGQQLGKLEDEVAKVGAALERHAGNVLAKHMAGGRMLTQAAGLVVGAGFVFMVGFTNDKTTLLIAMTCFGLCKGFYDANIFAALYDVITPHARGTAAGIMNTVGWGGGAIAPWAFGSFAMRGGGTEVQNMSQAISFGAFFYIVAALLLITAILFRAEKDVRKAS